MRSIGEGFQARDADPLSPMVLQFVSELFVAASKYSEIALLECADIWLQVPEDMLSVSKSAMCSKFTLKKAKDCDHTSKLSYS